MVLTLLYNTHTHEVFVTHQPYEPQELVRLLKTGRHPNKHLQRAYAQHALFEVTTVDLPHPVTGCTDEFPTYELFTQILEHLPYHFSRELVKEPLPVWYCMDYIH